ncbi:MAG: Permease of the major facilitator superfamily [Microgenomates group bacterium GW2011_GWA1_48_10]|uniref:Major facilitator superfamily (MFS) profile domain-containing protein n=1 Tax=Candidatus Gottesmanbacteria bacterium RIFCSPHIGHO2_01_FULL_47_48 TaxID=1798381 RepID=A0A1F5ZZ84_9BACT|nr:MAG: Permease of the major facilitator superfamily [Microgenomates group bacterium GW2011_GWA1_48_10]OGG17786.1 MAG: hypothetical protein A2721_02075 [Candidatus Gottesmanbacteria bacterium RIFCSPHIGHO2_01_FULL_47_48]
MNLEEDERLAHDIQLKGRLRKRNHLRYLSYFQVPRIDKFIFKKPLHILLLTNGMILLASAMLGPIYALFVDQVGGDLLDASLAGAAFSLAAGFTVLISGKITDRVKEQELILVFGYIIMGLGFLFYLLVSSMWTLLLAQIIIGFGEAIYVPAFDAVYSKHLDDDNIGSQWGAWESMNYFTAAAGAVVGGAIVTKFGFDPLFLIMGVLSVASGVYIYRLPRKVL